MMFPDVRGVFDCAGSRGDFVLAPPLVWSSPFVTGSTPWSFSFTAQYPACPCPCLRFAFSLSTEGARLGVGMGHYSFLVRLFHSRHHAGLSRRTTNPRPRTNIGDVIEERRGARDQDLAQRAPRFQLPVLPNLLLGAYAISPVGRNLPEFRLIE